MIKLLLYCTKDKYKPLYDLTYLNNGETRFGVVQHNKYSLVEDNYVNGKIVGVCDCEFVEEIFNEKKKFCWGEYTEWQHVIHTNKLCGLELFKKSCLKYDELLSYLDDKNGYALYLSNVKRFDEPKEVNTCWCYRNYNVHLKNAPQSMCNVYGFDGNYYILISIHPDHLYKILNGEKTIEVRKNILDDLRPLMETNKNVSNRQ